MSGTQKSETAYYVRSMLFKDGYKPIVVNLDSYYHTNWNERKAWRKKNFDEIGIFEIDDNAVLATIFSFYSDIMDTYILQANKFTGNIRHSFESDCNVLIIEGLYACYFEANIKIHLKGTEKQTFAFRKKRNKENEDDAYRKKVVKKECEEVEKLRVYADYEL